MAKKMAKQRGGQAEPGFSKILTKRATMCANTHQSIEQIAVAAYQQGVLDGFEAFCEGAEMEIAAIQKKLSKRKGA